MAAERGFEDELTAPGSRFELAVEEVRGRLTTVYRHRFRRLDDILEVAARRGNDETFIVYGARRIGFQSFVETSRHVSASLEALGVRKGDRIAILGQNSPEWCLAFWGSVGVGAISVGLNGWWTAEEITYGLDDSGARVLVVDRKRVERIVDRIGALRALELIVLTDCHPGDVGLERDPRVHGFEILTTTRPEPSSRVAISEDDPAAILYTSGTTGRPKGAVSSHRNMIANLQNALFTAAHNASRATEVSRPGTRVALFTAPLFHVSGLHSSLVTGLLGGQRLVMLRDRFEPERVLELIEEERVTLWASVPTMVLRVCRHRAIRTFDTSSVRTVVFGGSPSAFELQRLVRQRFPNVISGTNVYGLTETSSAVTVLSPSDALEKASTVGRPLPTVKVRIAAPDGTEARTGRPGEILVSGCTVMLGYWEQPDATRAVLDEDGWLHTGDLGCIDADGYLSVTDRQKDLVIRGGENVHCVEIEDRLSSHPDVIEAAVIGVPHPDLGEEVKAVVYCEASALVEADDLRSWVAEVLAPFKVPAHIDFRPTPLPRNSVGKVLKNELRGPSFR